MSVDQTTKEYKKSRREIGKEKDRAKRERKKQRSQSDIIPHPNEYRRKKQRDHEESYDY